MILFEDDILLPSQHYGASQRHLSGERRLMLAVLQEAVECVLKHPGYTGRATSAPKHRDRAITEAWRWLESNDTFYPFAFLRVCEYLQLDPAWVRKQITDIKEDEVKGRLFRSYIKSTHRIVA